MSFLRYRGQLRRHWGMRESGDRLCSPLAFLAAATAGASSAPCLNKHAPVRGGRNIVIMRSGANS